MELKINSPHLIFFIFLIIFSFLFCTSSNVEAATYAYYDPNSVSFKGSYIGVSRYYDGNFMAIETNATASDGVSREITINVYISSTNKTKTFTIYSDGKDRKKDYISIGGGSDVIISASCSDSSVTINLDLKTYSW